MSLAWEKITRRNIRSMQEGIRIIRDIITKDPRPTGWTTKELFDLAVKYPVPENFEKEASLSPMPLSPLSRKKKFERPPLPSHPEHPIRSVRFLKTSILPVLEGSQELKKRPIVRDFPRNKIPQRDYTGEKPKIKSGEDSVSVKIFAWLAMSNPNPPRHGVPPWLQPSPYQGYGNAVGVGTDFSHLNKRRQRTREEKLALDVNRARRVRHARHKELPHRAKEVSLQRQSREKKVAQIVREYQEIDEAKELAKHQSNEAQSKPPN